MVEPTTKGPRFWKPEMELGDAARRAQHRDAQKRGGAELSPEEDEEEPSPARFRRPRCGSRLYVSLPYVTDETADPSR